MLLQNDHASPNTEEMAVLAIGIELYVCILKMAFNKAILHTDIKIDQSRHSAFYLGSVLLEHLCKPYSINNFIYKLPLSDSKEI